MTNERPPLIISRMVDDAQIDSILGKVERILPSSSDHATWTTFLQLLPSLALTATPAYQARLSCFLCEVIPTHELATTNKLQPEHVEHLFKALYVLLNETTDYEIKGAAVNLATYLLPHAFYHSYIGANNGAWNGLAYFKEATLNLFDKKHGQMPETLKILIVRFWLKHAIGTAPAKKPGNAFRVESFSPFQLKSPHFLDARQLEEESKNLIDRILQLPYTGKLLPAAITATFNGLSQVLRERQQYLPSICQCWMSWRRLIKADFTSTQSKSIERTARNLLATVLKTCFLPPAIQSKISEALVKAGLRQPDIQRLMKVNPGSGKRPIASDDGLPSKRPRLEDPLRPDIRAQTLGGQTKVATPPIMTPSNVQGLANGSSRKTGPVMSSSGTSTISQPGLMKDYKVPKISSKQIPVESIPVEVVATLIIKTMRNLPEPEFRSALERARHGRVFEQHHSRQTELAAKKQRYGDQNARPPPVDKRVNRKQANGSVSAASRKKDKEDGPALPMVPPASFESAFDGNSSDEENKGKGRSGSRSEKARNISSLDNSREAVVVEEVAPEIHAAPEEEVSNVTAEDMCNRLLSYSERFDDLSSPNDPRRQFYVHTFGRLVSRFMTKPFKERIMKHISENINARWDMAAAWLSAEWVMDESGRSEKEHITWFHLMLDEMRKSMTASSIRILADSPVIDDYAINLLLEACTDKKTMVIAFRTIRELIDFRHKFRTRLLGAVLSFCRNPSRAVRSHAILTAKHHAFTIPSLRKKIESCALENFQALSKLDVGGDDLTGEVARHAELLMALATRKHVLLQPIFNMYAGFKSAIQKALRNIIPGPVKAIGMHSPFLLHFVETFNHGTESLMGKILSSLTEKEQCSPELVEAARNAISRQQVHPRFALPIVDALAKRDLRLVMSRYMAQLGKGEKESKLFKAMILRILQGRSPVDILINIHQLDGTLGLGIKQILEALSICLNLKDQFDRDSIASTLEQLIEYPKVPTLFMRTTIQSLSMYKDLEPLVAGILIRLISRKVWSTPKLWEGFMRALRMVQESNALHIILQLPQAQVEDVQLRWPQVKDKLKELIKQGGGLPPPPMMVHPGPFLGEMPPVF